MPVVTSSVVSERALPMLEILRTYYFKKRKTMVKLNVKAQNHLGELYLFLCFPQTFLTHLI